MTVADGCPPSRPVLEALALLVEPESVVELRAIGHGVRLCEACYLRELRRTAGTLAR